MNKTKKLYISGVLYMKRDIALMILLWTLNAYYNYNMNNREHVKMHTLKENISHFELYQSHVQLAVTAIPSRRRLFEDDDEDNDSDCHTRKK